MVHAETWDSGIQAAAPGFDSFIKKWNRINKREWGCLLHLWPLLGDVASSALWHMGQPNSENLPWLSLYGPDEHCVPHHFCLFRSLLPLCCTFCHMECQLNESVLWVSILVRHRKMPLWHGSLAELPHRYSQHPEEPPAQRGCVCAHSLLLFVHTPCLLLRHSSSEPSRCNHLDTSAMGAKHSWTLISLTTKSN